MFISPFGIKVGQFNLKQTTLEKESGKSFFFSILNTSLYLQTNKLIAKQKFERGYITVQKAYKLFFLDLQSLNIYLIDIHKGVITK